MDYSPPDSSVHGILQARILEWFAIPFSRTRVPAITTAISTKLERVIRSPQGKLNCRYSHMTMTDFILGGSKITVDGDCSHEIKKRLLLGRKSMTNLDTILKSRDITLLTKIHIVKAMVLLVVTYGCQSWTIKKVESQKLMLLNCGVGEDS